MKQISSNFPDVFCVYLVQNFLVVSRQGSTSRDLDNIESLWNGDGNTAASGSDGLPQPSWAMFAFGEIVAWEVGVIFREIGGINSTLGGRARAGIAQDHLLYDAGAGAVKKIASRMGCCRVFFLHGRRVKP